MEWEKDKFQDNTRVRAFQDNMWIQLACDCENCVLFLKLVHLFLCSSFCFIFESNLVSGSCLMRGIAADA